MGARRRGLDRLQLRNGRIPRQVVAGNFARCPISDTSLVGVPHARFLHDREEERLAEEGLYPWDD
ncbi:hypothetical protein SPW_5491 [Streptomyces sp. W007]|nr:hypothetical protein SPW_5491 [Streptomyces sp. W007]